MKYSVIIPTFNHCEDLLKPCLNSIIQHTTLNDIEIIIVANGCTDNTKEFVLSLGEPFKLLWHEKQLGYTKSTNLGISYSMGEFVILMNNDTVLLDFQQKNDWLNLLHAPFLLNEKMGITGPLQLYDYDVNDTFLVFCLVMIKRTLFGQLGILDEIFSPGYGEDIDFCLKAKKIGYEVAEINRHVDATGKRYSTFPFWHKSSKTFGEDPTYGPITVKRNQEILRNRYNNE